jgi:guanylate kinase
MKNSVKRGSLFVISGPSGVGKGTLVEMVRKNHPLIALSISATTRKPRPGEINGVHYFFLTRKEFEIRIELGEFIEWSEFAGNLYGTNRKFVEKILEDGHSLILEIDVRGALQVKSKMKEAVLIFIDAPSLDELRKRLFKRSTESEEEIQNRLAIVKSELEKKHEFNYVVLNDNIGSAYKNIENIILKELNKVNK